MWGVLAPLAVELEGLKKEVEIEKTLTRAQLPFWEGRWRGTPLALGCCGVGKVSAALGTQILIDTFPVKAVFFMGLAGALRKELQVGDCVLATETVQYDVSRPAAGREIGSTIHPGQLIFTTDTALFQKARQALKKGKEGFPHIFCGRILTGDRPVAQQERAQRLATELEGLCVEMEGAASAQVCAFNQVPFLLIRAISDRADEKAMQDFQANTEKACAFLTLAVKQVLSDLLFLK